MFGLQAYSDTHRRALAYEFNSMNHIIRCLDLSDDSIFSFLGNWETYFNKT